MSFSGTLDTSVQCKGMVISTGLGTEIGRISGLLSEIETLTTPLVAQMNVFASGYYHRRNSARDYCRTISYDLPFAITNCIFH